MDVNAFKGFWDVDGGDDTVFVNTYATGENTKVLIDPTTITVAAPKETLKEYVQQEKKTLHAERFFRVEDERKVGMFGISHALYWIGGIGLLIYFGVGGQWEHLAVVLGSMIVRSLLLQAIFKATFKTVQGTQPKIKFLANDLVYLAYFWVLGSISYQAKTTK